MKKTLVIMLALLMVIGLLAACSNNSTPSQSPSPTATATQPDDGDGDDGDGDDTPEVPQIDMSEKLNMTMYFIGDEPEGKAEVMTALNAVVEEKANMTITWNMLSWADYQARYPLILSSDEVVDLIFTSSMTNYNDHAKNGAYLAVNDLFQYVPEFEASIPEHFWAGMRSEDGNYYAIPSTRQYPRGFNIVYREDLREKYGAPVVNSMETLGEYYQAIVDNTDKAGMFPINLGLNDHMYSLYVNDKDFYDCPSVLTGNYNNNLIYSQIADPGAGFTFAYTDDDFRTFVHTMKEWYMNGYWSRSVLSNDTGTGTNYSAGLSASLFSNFDAVRSSTDSALGQDVAKEEGWKVSGWLTYEMTPSGQAVWTTTLQDCIAIPRMAQDPIRSMQLIALINLDQEVNDLTTRGILHKNFEIDESYTGDGPAPMYRADGQTGFDMGGWCFRNYATYRETLVMNWSEFEDYNIRARAATIGAANDGFRMDNTQWGDFIAECSAIKSEYHLQLVCGVATDVDATLDQAIARFQEAGIDDYLAAVNEAWAAYWAENKDSIA